MAQVMLNSGVRVTTAAQLQGLPMAKVKRMVSTDDLAERLADMRAQWNEATGGEMDRVTVNLSALFDDVAALLGIQ